MVQTEYVCAANARKNSVTALRGGFKGGALVLKHPLPLPNFYYMSKVESF